MPNSISAQFRDVNQLLQLEPEELAGVLMEYFNSLTPQEQTQLNRHNFLTYWGLDGFPQEARGKLQYAFAESWAWLERECLIALKPEAGGSYSYFITRRGQKLVDRNAFDAYRRATLFPRSLLHPRIDTRVYPSFLRGAYDTAVFEALREVEVSVRDACGFGPELYGKSLMRRAFGPPDGPLVDKTALKAEQESLADLFAGAIGLYKNASSHRTGTITDPTVATEIVVLASHLLRLVESRTA
jgi:uncharacterized protein (TIGR02391 family)